MTSSTTPAPFVPTPITADAFDAAYDAADPSQLRYLGPLHEGYGGTLALTTTIDGRDYQLTRVEMPNGELRRFAREHNGYADRRFGCAWTPAGVRHADGTDATYTPAADRPQGTQPVGEQLPQLPLLPPDQHNGGVRESDDGHAFNGSCSCGWHGPDHVAGTLARSDEVHERAELDALDDLDRHHVQAVDAWLTRPGAAAAADVARRSFLDALDRVLP